MQVNYVQFLVAVVVLVDLKNVCIVQQENIQDISEIKYVKFNN